MDSTLERWEAITSILEKAGWKYCESMQTGMMCKGSFLLVAHDAFSVNLCDNSLYYQKGQDVLTLLRRGLSASNKVARRRSFVIPNKCQWHVEQNGWLIASGMVDYNSAESVATEIDNCSLMSVAEINSVKTRKVLVDKDETILVAKSAAPNYGIGSYFRAVDPQIFSYFKEGVVYKIDGVSEETQQLIIKTMNNSLTKTRRVKDFLVDVDAFVSLANNHFLETVVLDYGVEKKQVSKWIKLQEDLPENLGAVKLPTLLQNLCKSRIQERFLCMAYSQGYNCTGLLVPRMSESYYKKVYELLQSSVDVASIVRKCFSEDFMLTLLDLLVVGYKLDEIQEMEYSKAELLDMLQETDARFVEQYSSFIKTCSYPETISYLKALFFEPVNVMPFLANQPKVYVQLQRYHQLYPSSITDTLLQHGFIGDTQVYSSVDAFEISTVKELLHGMLEHAGLSTNGVDALATKVTTVAFRDNALALRLSHLILSVDSNSFFVKDDSTGKFVYRRMLLNSDYVDFGDKELFDVE